MPVAILRVLCVLAVQLNWPQDARDAKKNSNKHEKIFCYRQLGASEEARAGAARLAASVR